MKLISRIFLCFFISVSAVSIVNAGDIDLSIELNLEPTTEVEFLQTGTFSITVSNFGPDTAGGDSTSNFPVSAFTNEFTEHENGFQDLYIGQDEDIEQDCFFVLLFGEPLPGGLPSIVYGFAYPEIPANEFITCYGKYLIAFENGSRDFSFNVRSFSDNETNLSNNTANFTFRIKPKSIPTLNFYAILILIVLMIFIARYLKPKVWNTCENSEM